MVAAPNVGAWQRLYELCVANALLPCERRVRRAVDQCSTDLPTQFGELFSTLCAYSCWCDANLCASTARQRYLRKSLSAPIMTSIRSPGWSCQTGPFNPALVDIWAGRGPGDTL